MTENPQPTTRTWRDRLPRRLPSGRKAVAAGAVVAALAVGGAGFGAGYAVADSGSSDTATTQTTDDWGDRGFPGDGDGRGPMGEMGEVPAARWAATSPGRRPTSTATASRTPSSPRTPARRTADRPLPPPTNGSIRALPPPPTRGGSARFGPLP